MNENTTKSRNYIIAGVLVLLLCALALRSCGSLSDNGSGADAIGNQLEEAGNNQSTITGGISNAEKSVSNINASIERSEEEITKAGATVSNIENQQREAGAIIADCQSIVKAVRERGKRETAQP